MIQDHWIKVSINDKYFSHFDSLAHFLNLFISECRFNYLRRGLNISVFINKAIRI